MREVIYWVGLVHVAGYTVFGAGLLADKLVDSLLKTLGLQREFLAFAWDRLKRKRRSSTQPRVSDEHAVREDREAIGDKA